MSSNAFKATQGVTEQVTAAFDPFDTPKHECGVALLRLVRTTDYYDTKYGPGYPAGRMRMMMDKQKNRGQDGAGVACIRFDCAPGEEYLNVVKSNARTGPIGDCWDQVAVRKETDPKSFVGNVYLGHVRYGTFGGNQYENLHPVIKESNAPGCLLALAGNFNLTNTHALVEEQLRLGMCPLRVTDTRLCLDSISYFLGLELRRRCMQFCATGANAQESMRLAEANMDIAAVLRSAAESWDGGYLLCGMIGTGCSFAFRDPHGIRPAYWYGDSEFVAVASESSAIAHSFHLPSSQQIHSIPPGCALMIPKSSQPFIVEVLPKLDYRSCVFERIYFSRPTDSPIYEERKRLGAKLVYLCKRLERETQGQGRVIVSFVPNSAETACHGLVNAALEAKVHVHFEKVVYKETTQRTFIQEPGSRADLVKSSYETLPGLVKPDDTILLLDDSIVRGSTLKQALVPKLCALGAKRVIFASTAPQIRYPDCYGIDIARLDDLAAFRAAIALHEESGNARLIADVYRQCVSSLADKDFRENHVKRIYQCFTPEVVTRKITEMLTPTGEPFEIAFQTIADMHDAIPDHRGDWVFTGDFATPGGTEAVMRAFVNYFEGSTARSYAFAGEKVVVLGSGGREHALALTLAKSSRVSSVICIPGNGGSFGGKLRRADVPLSAPNFDDLIAFCQKERVGLVVVGPEQPLVNGVVDALVLKGIAAFGPTAAAAQIESSKAFSKAFMKRHGIPSAPHGTFVAAQRTEALKFIEDNWPVVVKASGLCAGKGVLIPATKAEAVTAFDEMQASFGSAGEEVVIEKRLEGREVSVFALTDGENVICLPPAQDYKRAKDHDMGPNTGGMGAICPVEVPETDLAKIEADIKLAVKGMREDGIPFRGLLYAGLMLTPDGPMVLEYNCRFGDPETQAVLQVIEGDMFEALLACAGKGSLLKCDLQVSDKFACGVVLASGGYPGKYETGKLISGLGEIEKLVNVKVIHAGTTLKDGLLVTSGGRVMVVVATAATLEQATANCYRAMRLVEFEGQYSRGDIGRQRDVCDTPLNRKSRHSLTYEMAGVDISAGNAAVEGIKDFVKATGRPGCDMSSGSLQASFGGVCDLKAIGYKDPVLISGTDGVGTKLKVAHAMKAHDTIGQDLVAMCVNDCLVHGAEPLFFLDYFATGKLQVEEMVNVVRGIAEGCMLANCALIGGETAEMPGMYAAGEYDVAGFSCGVVERHTMLPKGNVAAGDVVIGIASSGVHSNGLSLMRALVQQAALSYADPAPWSKDKTVGADLLTPTRIYVRSVLPLMKAGKVKAAAHITGGGLIENLPRCLPKDVAAKLDASTWELPLSIRWAISRGVLPDEALRTFNCGVGFCLVVPAASAAEVTAELRAAGETAAAIGSLVPRGDGAAVRVEAKGLEEWCVSPFSEVAEMELPLRVGILANGDGALGTLMAVQDAVGLHVAGVALLHDSPAVEDFCAEQNIPCACCLLDQAAELLENFAAEAVIALHLPRSTLNGKLCTQWRHRMLASVPSLSPFVTGVEDADDMIGFVVRTGSKYTGCTVFRVVENQPTQLAGLPTMWPVVAQEIVELGPQETAKSLRRKVDGRDCLGKAFVESLKTLSEDCKRIRAESAAASAGFIRSRGSYNHFVASIGNTDV